MIFEVINMSLALPEIFMMIMGCIIVLVVSYMGANSGLASYWLSQLSLVVTAVIIYQSLVLTSGITFDGGYIKDPLSDVLKISICVFIHYDRIHGL